MTELQGSTALGAHSFQPKFLIRLDEKSPGLETTVTTFRHGSKASLLGGQSSDSAYPPYTGGFIIEKDFLGLLAVSR